MERQDKQTQVDLPEGRVLSNHLVRVGFDDKGAAMHKQERETLHLHTTPQATEFLKAETLANISHELRSPLASIKGYTATLLRHEQRLSSQERHEFLLAINESCERLVHIVNAFLELADLETGSIMLHRAPVELAYLVRDAITVMEQRLQASSTTGHQQQGSNTWSFTFQVLESDALATHEPLILEADAQLLREVLDQVLENAVMHAQKHGTINVVIHPSITAETLASLPCSSQNTEQRIAVAMQHHQHMLALCVSDEGKGIEPHLLERIFDRFYQIDTELTREVNGLGLGLAMCKHIVELHGGVMWAESEVGKGSTFFLLLPYGHDEHERKPFVHTNVSRI